ncbi:hypothetical protein GE09DRAFT_252072 [Coniochaeta sp. 2T2.1]|nr:hypothetical protein GE09DRAFT_252072 [Coniochaeta sp. 2T2.1]
MWTSASHPIGLSPSGSRSIQQSADSDNCSKPAKPKEHFRISCPFWAKDPLKYNIRDHGKCALHVYHTMAEVRQHVKNYHTHPDAPFYNPELVKRILKDDGRGGSRIENQWEVLWKLLFPGYPIRTYGKRPNPRP